MTETLWCDVIDADGALIPAPVFTALGNAPIPHTAWQRDPLGWIEKYLEVPRHTLQWSLDPAYRKHKWDGTKDPIAEMMRAIARGEDTGVESGTGTGKAQPLTEPVLTPNGWRHLGEINAGDFVIGANGRATLVTAVTQRGMRPIFRVAFSDGASTRACAEHLWTVRSKSAAHRDDAWKTVETQELARMLGRSPTSSYRVPTPAPVQYEPVDLSLDPYLLGALLGDGGFTGDVPVLTSADAQIVAEVAAVLPDGVRVMPRPQKYTFGLSCGNVGGSPNPLTIALRAMDLMGKKSEHKHIPLPYTIASPAARLSLLQGLMDTDGWVDSRGIAEFTSTSQVLAEGVVGLVRSLGGTASRRQKASWLGDVQHLDAHTVSVRLPSGLNPFRLHRKAERVNVQRQPARVLRSITPDGEADCACLTVAAADGLYVTKDFIVTHNSFGAACVILWFLACWAGARVFTYAPKEDQLRLFIWAEMAELWPKFARHFPTAEMTDLRIRMYGSDKWSAHGISTQVSAGEESAAKAQGAHAPHMLHVTEETPGILTPVMTAIRNTRGGSHNVMLALGNPNDQQDPLHHFCELKTTTAIRVSALDHPNVVTGRDVIPGAMSRKGIALIAQEDEPGTPMYESRVRGISPAEAVNALIRLSWLQAAALKFKAMLEQGGPRALGVDVANSENGDKASRAYMVGPCLEKVTAERCPNSNALGREVIADMQALAIDPSNVGIDPVGVGAGTVNTLEDGGYTIVRCGGSQSPVQQAARGADGSAMTWVPDANRFKNLRGQMAWQLREDLRMGRFFLRADPKLWKQMTAWRFKVDDGRVIIEKKEVMMARTGMESPNEFDAIIYANWVRARDDQTQEQDAGSDDRHPGLDYKAKKIKPKHRRIPEPGEDPMVAVVEDDLRPGRYHMPQSGWHTPRYFGQQDFDDEGEE